MYVIASQAGEFYVRVSFLGIEFSGDEGRARRFVSKHHADAIRRELIKGAAELAGRLKIHWMPRRK